MNALVLMLVAATELSPPPLVEAPATAPDSPAPAVLPGPAGAPAPARGPEVDFGPQIAFIAVQGVHGVWFGLNACGAGGCFNTLNVSSVPYLASGLTGLAAGVGLSFLGRDLASDWGRSLMIDSGSVAGAILGLYLGFRPGIPSMEQRYLTALLVDGAVTAGMLGLATQIKPRPESVWLADSTAVWGALAGGLLAASSGQGGGLDAGVIGGLAGAGAGALLAVLTPRLTVGKLLAANGLALLGGLALGAVVGIFQAFNPVVGGLPNPAMVPLATCAGVAGGFAVGFALGE